jgi:hypothetical protein
MLSSYVIGNDSVTFFKRFLTGERQDGRRKKEGRRVKGERGRR